MTTSPPSDAERVPRPHHPLVRDAADGTLDLDAARERIRDAGTPLLGPVHDGLCDVTFVLEDLHPEDGAILHLRSLVQRAVPGEHRLHPVPGTPWHALTVTLPSDLRFSYAFERRALDGRREELPDPWNRTRRLHDERLAGAVAVLPDARPLPALDRIAETPESPLQEVELDSEALGERRRVWVSPPSTGGTDLPVVIVFDGTPHHTAPAVRDVLLADGVVAPALVVLVDQAGLRDRDLTGSPAFTRFLAEELVPLLRTRYGATRSAAGTILSGSSFGGLCAGWTALRRPDVFGGAILQSPSCWYHPDLALPGRPAPELVSAPTPVLLEAFSTAPAAPVRIFQEVGSLELGPPPAQVFQVLGNRWLHEVLTARGYATTYREFAGGHDAAWWRGTWADALTWMLPADGAPGGPGADLAPGAAAPGAAPRAAAPPGGASAPSVPGTTS